MTRVFSSRYFFIFLCLLFRVALDASYVLFVVPVFSYNGYILDFIVYIYFSSWLIYIVCLFFTPHIINKVSDYFLASFLLTIIAPLSSLVGLSDTGFYPLLTTFFVFLFFRLFQYSGMPSKLMPTPNFVTLTEGRQLSLIVAFVSVVILVVWYFYSGAFQYFNLNLMKVYEFRELSGELASVGFFAYFNNWVFGVFSIFLMCYCLYKRKFLSFSSLVIIQVFFFGVSNHKSVLLYPVMIFFMWLYFSRTRAMSVLPFGFSFIVVGCLLLYLHFDHVIAGSFLIRRVFFVPAKLTLDYFSFFSFNDFVWWSNSVLSSFSVYPYDFTLSKVIGEYNGSGSSANNGFIASGYAHAGLIGVAVYSVIFTYFLKFLDKVVVKSDVPVWLALGITIVPLRAALISSDLFTTMLTHGLALSLLIVLLFRRKPKYIYS